MGLFDGKSQKQLAAAQSLSTKELNEFAKCIEERNRQTATQYERGMQDARQAQLQSLQPAMYDQARNAALQQQLGLANTGMSGLFGGRNPYANQVNAVAQEPPITADSLNNDPVYGPSLDVLRDLWLARWGDGWSMLTSAAAGEDVRYWFGVMNRLERAYMLERHPNGSFFKLR